MAKLAVTTLREFYQCAYREGAGERILRKDA
jgi:hypothetical protein